MLVLSLPHGKPADGILEEILPKLNKGDIIIDAGNEWWADTERRQAKAGEKGIKWVGMGVSGGCKSHIISLVYAERIDQAARHGPSMSVGTDPETWEIIKPYLEKWSARAPSGEPCVNRMGPGGAGHCQSFTRLVTEIANI
jgi:6-phosphogluconate dehydrogenase